MVIVEVGQDDVNNDVLNELQTLAGDGRMAEAMAGYIVWLAGRPSTSAFAGQPPGASSSSGELRAKKTPTAAILR